MLWIRKKDKHPVVTKRTIKLVFSKMLAHYEYSQLIELGRQMRTELFVVESESDRDLRPMSPKVVEERVFVITTLLHAIDDRLDTI